MTRFTTKFKEFHGRAPRRLGEFSSSLVIPDTTICVGEAKQILYRSDKCNPTSGEDEGWTDYYHDHGKGVHLYRCDRAARSLGEECAVPAWIRNVQELTWLGFCMGYTYQDADGRTEKARASDPLPELFCVPSGKALLVIQSKRTLLAMIWGGRLGVEDRGIVH